MSALWLCLLANPPALGPEVIVGAEVSIYRPSIDRELGGSTPFGDLFGKGRGPLVRGRLGVVWRLGDFSFGGVALVGFYSTSARAFVDDGGAGRPSSSGKRSGGETDLTVIPISIRAVTRYYGLAERLSVPIAPYFEAGFAWSPWIIGRGGGQTAASGSSSGIEIGGGVQLLLEALDRRAARTLAAEAGVSHVALSAGVELLFLDGFGGRTLDLGDTAWTIGLELSF